MSENEMKDDQRAGDEDEHQEDPTISVDVCFLLQKDLGNSIPTLVARDHMLCYTHAFTCPGKSTKEEEYSEGTVHKCKILVEMLRSERVAMKSDQETAMRALPSIIPTPYTPP